MRLIDADALLDGLGKWKNDDPYRTLRRPWERWVRAVGIQVLEIVVKQMKPVDAVEVVRCKDCKYKATDENVCLHPDYCGGGYVIETFDNCYCSRGEPRNK